MNGLYKIKDIAESNLIYYVAETVFDKRYHFKSIAGTGADYIAGPEHVVEATDDDIVNTLDQLVEEFLDVV